jgi:hypothetical protein
MLKAVVARVTDSGLAITWGKRIRQRQSSSTQSGDGRIMCA